MLQCHLPTDKLDEAIRVSEMDFDLKLRVPPVILGSTVHLNSRPRFVSNSANTFVSLIHPLSESFILVHVKVSLVFNSLSPCSSTWAAAVCDKRSSFLAPSETITLIMTITATTSTKVNPLLFEMWKFLCMVNCISVSSSIPLVSSLINFYQRKSIADN